MTRHPSPLLPAQRGVSLVEVLITMVVLAFGLLGLAAFQTKTQVGSIESYQRAQAAVLLQDMQSRLSGNSADAANYLTTTPLGTGDGQDTDCSTAAAGSARPPWRRGCITQVQVQNTARGVCTPAIYLVSVAWQGLHATRAPAQACAKDKYGADTNRRVISARVAVGLPTCV
jgi:type IV pilus assembly protein PilV